MSHAPTAFVPRKALVEALRSLSTAGNKAAAGPAVLRVHFATMMRERARHSQEVPGERDAGFDGTHLSFGRYRHPASAASEEDLLDAVAARVRDRRIARAVRIFAPYGVRATDLQPLCGASSHFIEVGQALTDRVAKEWAELAPDGVRSETLGKIISNKVKNVWRR